MYDFLLNSIHVKVDEIRGKVFLITGSSGLIGKRIVKELHNMSEEYNLGIKLILLARNFNKFDEDIKKLINNGNISFIENDINYPINYYGEIDYIIHTVSITDSTAMIKKPTEVIFTNINGTKNILNLSVQKNVKSVIYLSTMEIYGFSTESKVLSEDNIQYLNPLSLRSSYPESKRMCENICIAYFSQYNVPVKIVRLAQTFGKGVAITDKRVFAEFARCAKENRSIALLTNGESKRMYLDTYDAVTAIITILLKGKNGEAYNAANKDTYCSILEMAQFVAREIAKQTINVNFFNSDVNANKFSPSHKLYLDTTKLDSLGWKATKGLKNMYLEMMEDWE